MQLHPQSYGWKDDTTGRRSIGFIAPEVRRIFPELVQQNQGSDDYLTMDYAGFGVIAIQAIQEQQQLIDALEKKVNELSEAIQELLNRK